MCHKSCPWVHENTFVLKSNSIVVSLNVHRINVLSISVKEQNSTTSGKRKKKKNIYINGII